MLLKGKKKKNLRIIDYLDFYCRNWAAAFIE